MPDTNAEGLDKCQCVHCTGKLKEPMPIVMACPECGVLHVDGLDEVTGIDWSKRPHKRHQCQSDECPYFKTYGKRYEWQPALIDTVGVCGEAYEEWKSK